MLMRIPGPFRATTILLLMASAALESAAAQEVPAADSTAPLTLRPGDVISINIWREPDLSGEFVVNERGEVILPLLGTQPVADVPMDEVRDFLLSRYLVHLRNPSINITPLRRVNILGEVSRPGLYQVDPTISLAGAIALAGGVSPAGDMSKIRIVRNGQIVSESVGPGASLHSVDVHSGDQIVVLERSWFERNSTFVVSLVLSVASIVIGLVR